MILCKSKKLLLLLLFLILFSCSSKPPVEYDEEGNPLVFEDDYAEETESVDQDTSTPTSEYEEDIAVDNVDTLDFKAIKKKYNLSKSTLLLLDNSLEEILPVSRDNTFTSEIVLDEDGNVISETQEEKRVDPIIEAGIHFEESLDNYANKFFPQYKKLAKSRFKNRSKLNIEDIKAYAAYIDSSLILIKAFYQDDIGYYLYDIMYLDGEIFAEGNYWYRNISEAVPLLETLTRLKISDLDSYDNILLPQISSSKRENIAPLSEIQQQEKLLAFRVNNVVGLWQDLITSDIYEVRELPQGNLRLPNKKYAGYLLLDADINDLKVNSSLNWVSGDLAFEFNIYNTQGFFLNKEKMTLDARISLFSAKGMMIIYLPNKQYKYLIPIVPEIDGDLYDELYKYIEDKNKTTVKKDPILLDKYGDNELKLDGISTFSLGWLYPVLGLTLFFLILAF